MKLALGLDLYRDGDSLKVPVESVRLAERLGYHSVWTAEAYGTDAFSPLAFLAAHTSRIKLATGVVQTAARSAATTATTAMTIDAFAGGGRVILGIGLSGPQVVEGWHGVPWRSPTEWLRDYVAVMRKVIARTEPVTHQGRVIRLPYDGPDGIGQGKPLKSILHPAGDIEIWIASGGPRNTALTAEIADGWLPMGYGSDGAEVFAEPLSRGRAKRDPSLRALEVFAGVSMFITDDVAGKIAAQKPLIAMFVGGMGSDTHNFHADSLARRGYPEASARITELWRAGRRAEATAAVPDEYIDGGWLIGSPDRIRRRWDQVVPGGLTGVIVRPDSDDGLKLAAELAGL